MKQENVSAWEEGTDWAFHERQYSTPYKSTIKFADFLDSNNLLKAGSTVADIGAGMGGVIYYLSTRFPCVKFNGIELNLECVDKGKQRLESLEATNCNLEQGNIFELQSYHKGKYDGAVCLASLLCFPEAESPIRAMADLEPNWIAISSLFNESLVEATVVTKDYSRPYGTNLSTDKFYNIYSIERTFNLLSRLGYSNHTFQRFNIDIDLPKPPHSGMGTYTERLENGNRLQISGPVLMSWYFILARRTVTP